MNVISSLLPCSSPKLHSEVGKQENGLKSRICPYIKAAPAVVVLAVCIVALITSLAWKQMGLSLTFAIGTAAAIYGLYLAIDLKPLSEVRKGLENENKALRQVRDDLQTEVDRLRTQTNEQIQSLQQVNLSLLEIETSASQNHKTFSEKIGIFQDALGQLEGIREKFSTSQSEVSQTAQTQIQLLVNTGKTLTGIFQQISAWKDDKRISKQIEQLQALQNVQRETLEEQKKLQKELSELEKQISFARGQIEQLKEIREGFQKNLTVLEENVQKLQNQTADFNKLREALTAIGKISTVFQSFAN